MSLQRALPLLQPTALAALGLTACLNAYPQRVPGPLVLPDDATDEERPRELPGASHTVTVQRDSDPVWVRRPGERGDYPLPFYQKRERVPIGAVVRTGAGGRAELLWSPDATAVSLFDECRVSLGDPELDQPLVRFHSLSRALLQLTPEDRIELVGGPLLAGDALEPTGPLLLESVPGSIVRVTNQSKRLATVAFRDERLELGPGESIDLPVLATGAAPRVEEGEPEGSVLGAPVAFLGQVDQHDGPDGVSVTALEPALVAALGIAARLDARQTARFSGLSPRPRGQPDVPSPEP